MLDLGCGIGGSARYLAANFRCKVTGVDLSPGFIDAVFLQHVAMNVADRNDLYAEMRRILTPGGRLAIYDLVLRDGDVLYPAPWARDASTSFLLSAGDTRIALEQAGFKAVLWRDDTQIALDWFKAAMAGAPRNGPNLGPGMGADFQVKTSNLARNIRANRLGVLSQC